jgi:alpha-D-ribose 1-methylphosphonate 5-phosphate C-P lyase
MHALGEYGLMHVKLYEDIARFGHRHLLCLSGQGQCALRDGPVADAEIRQSEMDNCPALQLFGAGREKRIYAIPPHIGGVARFRVIRSPAIASTRRARCAGLMIPDSTKSSRRRGQPDVRCSDTDHCESRQALGIAAAKRGSAQGETAYRLKTPCRTTIGLC